MCAQVTTVYADALHTGNGCPGPQPLGQHTVPGAPGDPALYTEDEQWFETWAQNYRGMGGEEVQQGAQLGDQSNGGVEDQSKGDENRMKRNEVDEATTLIQCFPNRAFRPTLKS